MKKDIRNLLIFAVLVAAAGLAALGCGKTEKVEEAAAAPAVSATPELIQLEFIATPAPTPAITEAPTPEPTPAVTEVPFSYYAPTVNMSYEELVGSTDDIGKSGKELLKDGYPDPKTYYIIVDKQWQVVLIYKRLDDGTKLGKPDYDNPVRYMLCSSGNPKKEYGHDTTSGIWQIQVPKERFYQFVNLEAAQYLTLIHSRTYFHSILYDKARDLSTLIQESYDDLGKKASHACIRLTVPDCRWIWYNIGYGTTCEIRDGSADDTETGAIRAQLVLPPSIKNVKLKASAYTWTDNWSIEDVAHELPYKYQEAPKPDLGEGDDDTSDTNATAAPNAGTVTTPVPAGDVGPDAGIPAVTEVPVVTAAPVVTPPPVPPEITF